MPKYLNQRFDGLTITLDGQEYDSCVFEKCRFVYSGGEPPIFNTCSFADCAVRLDGPALRTSGFLAEWRIIEAEMQQAEPNTAECAEKTRLLHNYQVALADLSRAVQVLLKRSNTMRKTKYIKIRDYSESARLKSEATRKELDRHTAEHGCSS